MRGILAPLLGLSLLLPLAAPTVAAAAPVTYQVAGGTLAVKVLYDRSALIGGHDHILSSDQFTGTVTWDADNVAACKVSLTLPAKTLVVDAPGMRSRFGLEGETSESDRGKIRENALGKSQLDADSHPNLTFESTACAPQGDKVKVTGKLTLRGQAKTVTSVMTVSAADATFSGSGSFAATHEDFGFKPYTALLGSLRNDTHLSFTVDVKGKAP